MALTITEDWIRERVNLKHNNLEDVRSLSLPGTYQEKIGSLGDSLKHFTRLKSLDLSRNAIESLAGVENLKLLEKLNIYYNNISTLPELLRLKHCQNLQDLDLRLNPVARTESDYRLFLIHMLPNLQKLDDRAIRDNERKAALMHFTTDQAAELTPPTPVKETKEKRQNPRAEHVKSLGRPFAVDNDDARLMEGLDKRGPDAKSPFAEDYPIKVARNMDRLGIGYEQMEKELAGGDTLTNTESELSSLEPPEAPPSKASFLAKYPHILALSNNPSSSPGNEGHVVKQPKFKNQFMDADLSFGDEIEAYTSYKAQGNFTPHPDLLAPKIQPVPVLNENVTPTVPPFAESRQVELYEAESASEQTVDGSTSSTMEETGRQAPTTGGHESKSTTEVADGNVETLDLPPAHRSCLEKISELADKYWNGSRSLLKHPRFRTGIAKLLQDFDSSVGGNGKSSDGAVSSSALRDENQRLRDENYQLKEKLLMGGASSRHRDGEETDEQTLRNNYVKAQRDVIILKTKLQKCLDENQVLEEKLAQGRSTSRDSAAYADGTSAKELELLRQDNEQLRQQSAAMNARLKQMQQMQELANMLQESHKSLTLTNQHLLRELDDIRQQYTKAQSTQAKRSTPNGS